MYSAGIGRSGTFCLVDSCLVLVEKEGENKISVSDLLLELRQSRMGLIQTADQLYFSYQAIIEGIKHFNDPVSVYLHNKIVQFLETLSYIFVFHHFNFQRISVTTMKFQILKMKIIQVNQLHLYHRHE